MSGHQESSHGKVEEPAVRGVGSSGQTSSGAHGVPSAVSDVFEAAKRGDAIMLKRLCTASPDLAGARDEHQETPLHWAALRGHTRAVKALLAAGANPCLVNNGGMTPLHFAAERGHADVATAILKAPGGQDAYRVKDNVGARPIDAASTSRVKRAMQQTLGALNPKMPRRGKGRR